MSDGMDPATRRVLDALVPPPLSSGFAERVMAGIAVEAVQPPLPPVVTRRSHVRGWRRSGIVVAGLAGFGVISAAAAAGGVFGENLRQSVREAPVLGPIIASVAPEKPKRVKPKPSAAKVAATKPVFPDSAAPSPAEDAPPVGAMSPEDLRRAIIAERVTQRMERRERIRTENGLPPRAAQPDQMRRRMQDMTAEQRAVMRERIRAARAERLEARLQKLSPEKRAMVEERIKARRAARATWRARQQDTGPAEPESPNPSTPAPDPSP